MTLEEQRRTMLAGKMYNDLTPELIQAREQAVFLTNEYNASFGQPQAEREAILSQLFKSVGHGAYFEPSFRCEFGFNISIGDNFYANFDCVMLEKRSLLRSATAAGRYLLGGNPKIVKHFQARKIDIRSTINEPTDVDGQPGAEFPLYIECLPGELRIMCEKTK